MEYPAKILVNCFFAGLVVFVCELADLVIIREANNVSVVESTRHWFLPGCESIHTGFYIRAEANIDGSFLKKTSITIMVSVLWSKNELVDPVAFCLDFMIINMSSAKKTVLLC